MYPKAIKMNLAAEKGTEAPTTIKGGLCKYFPTDAVANYARAGVAKLKVPTRIPRTYAQKS